MQLAFIVLMAITWVLCALLVQGLVYDFCDTRSRWLNRSLFILGLIIAPIVCIVVVLVFLGGGVSVVWSDLRRNYRAL